MRQLTQIVLLWTLCAWLGGCTSSPHSQEKLTTTPTPAPSPAKTPAPVEGPARAAADGTTAADVEAFEDGDLWGFRKKGGAQVVLAPRYSFAYDFDPTSGLAGVVIPDEGWWHIDITGRKVYRAFIYDNGPDYMAEGLMRFIGPNGKVGYLNARGEVAIPAQFDWAGVFEDGAAKICSGCAEEDTDHEHKRIVGGQWGSIDTTGRITWEKTP